MKKHYLILALVLCLALTALAACTAGGSGDTDTEANPSAETWLCACGVGSSGKFCPECGEARPEPETTDTANGETDAATEPADSDGTSDESEPVTEPGTEPDSETEAVTHAPRYDYFDADVKADVTIDKSVYTDMQLTLPADLEITEEDVQSYIDYVLFQYRTADNGTTQVTDKAMKWGDDAYIYYKGMIDGEAFEGGSNWDDASPYQLGLGSGNFIPGFEAGLVGVVPANATKDSPAEVHVTFPENYNPALAGKDAVFYVAVVYAVQYTLPEYNRATVENVLKYEGQKDFYASDAAYLSEFEDYVRAYLESDIAEQVEYEKINALWNHLTGQAVCQNLPQLELDYYHDAYLEEIEYYYDYYKSYGGTDFTEQYPDFDSFAKSYMGVSGDAHWETELNKLCEDMVKKDMISHAIAELEGFETITDEEFKAELKYWVDYYQGYMTEEEILANMGEDVIREGALSEKVQKWLLERASFTYGDTE
ncbi:MAG: FKBP-type peptidyl-prolyl cis-trans isomerase [Clostridia bacterium]|nr:FKBP-type peptidyl-prolyl cis-trans isomerase [Clostridia bacterium]